VARNFKDLSEQEILADYPATAKIFEEMEAEEDEHRGKLIGEYRRRFGEHIPLICREDVKGFVHRKPVV
jgi:hypothetical protein